MKDLIVNLGLIFGGIVSWIAFFEFLTSYKNREIPVWAWSLMTVASLTTFLGFIIRFF